MTNAKVCIDVLGLYNQVKAVNTAVFTALFFPELRYMIQLFRSISIPCPVKK